jgi:hypothetical protein
VPHAFPFPSDGPLGPETRRTLIRHGNRRKVGFARWHACLGEWLFVAVSRGVVPRFVRNGPGSMLRDATWKAPEGMPEVPPEWAPFVLKKPVDATSSEVLANQVAILNAGATVGLKSGMEVVRADLSPPFFPKVLFTEADRSGAGSAIPIAHPLPNHRPRPSRWRAFFGPSPSPWARRFPRDCRNPGEVAEIGSSATRPSNAVPATWQPAATSRRIVMGVHRTMRAGHLKLAGDSPC